MRYFELNDITIDIPVRGITENGGIGILTQQVLSEKALLDCLNKLVGVCNMLLGTPPHPELSDGVGEKVNADLKEYKLKVKRILEFHYTSGKNRCIIFNLAQELGVDLDV